MPLFQASEWNAWHSVLLQQKPPAEALPPSPAGLTPVRIVKNRQDVGAWKPGRDARRGVPNTEQLLRGKSYSKSCINHIFNQSKLN